PHVHVEARIQLEESAHLLPGLGVDVAARREPKRPPVVAQHHEPMPSVLDGAHGTIATQRSPPPNPERKGVHPMANSPTDAPGELCSNRNSSYPQHGSFLHRRPPNVRRRHLAA